MIRDKPVFGQGPGMILRRLPEYRWPEAPNPAAAAPARQRPADRGRARPALPRLLAVDRGRGHGRRLARGAAGRRRAGARWPRSAVLAAFMVAGLFEYNFGDSEMLMFTLLVAALPYALRRQRGARPSGRMSPLPFARARACSGHARPARPRGRRRDARRVPVGQGRPASRRRPRCRWSRSRRESFHLGGAGNVAAQRARPRRARRCSPASSATMRAADARARGAGGRRASRPRSRSPTTARPTTVKTRIIAHHQQVVRADREVTDDIADELEDALLASACARGCPRAARSSCPTTRRAS